MRRAVVQVEPLLERIRILSRHGAAAEMSGAGNCTEIGLRRRFARAAASLFSPLSVFRAEQAVAGVAETRHDVRVLIQV
jgi:transposase InsO family protein